MKPLSTQQLRSAINQSYYDKSAERFTQATKLSTKALGDKHPLILSICNNFACLLGKQGRYIEAEPKFLHALEVKKLLVGFSHQETLRTVERLCNPYQILHRYFEAEGLATQVVEAQSLKLDSSILGMEWTNTEAVFRNNVVREEHNQPGNLDALDCVVYLAQVHATQGQYERAERTFMKIIPLYQLHFGYQHVETLRVAEHVAGLYRVQLRNFPYFIAKPFKLLTQMKGMTWKSCLII